MLKITNICLLRSEFMVKAGLSLICIIRKGTGEGVIQNRLPKKRRKKEPKKRALSF